MPKRPRSGRLAHRGRIAFCGGADRSSTTNRSSLSSWRSPGRCCSKSGFSFPGSDERDRNVAVTIIGLILYVAVTAGAVTLVAT
jgi:hypothetical protein